MLIAFEIETEQTIEQIKKEISYAFYVLGYTEDSLQFVDSIGEAYQHGRADGIKEAFAQMKQPEAKPVKQSAANNDFLKRVRDVFTMSAYRRCCIIYNQEGENGGQAAAEKYIAPFCSNHQFRHIFPQREQA